MTLTDLIPPGMSLEDLLIVIKHHSYVSILSRRLN